MDKTLNDHKHISNKTATSKLTTFHSALAVYYSAYDRNIFYDMLKK